MDKGQIMAKFTLEIAPWKASRFVHLEGTLDTTPCAWIDKRFADAGLRPDFTMTNEAASKNEKFVEVCEMAGVKPTARQASKFRNGFGALWEKYKREALEKRRKG